MESTRISTYSGATAILRGVKQVCLAPDSIRSAYIIGLVLTQVGNVVGSLILKQAMISSNPPHPVTFALYREVLAGVLLTVFASGLHRTAMKREYIAPVAALGVCLFLNQLLFIVGLHLAGVTLAACMQPAIPVFTSLLSMLVGQELVSGRRITGTLLATLGAATMVYGASLPRPGTPATSLSALAEPAGGGLSSTHSSVRLRMLLEGASIDESGLTPPPSAGAEGWGGVAWLLSGDIAERVSAASAAFRGLLGQGAAAEGGTIGGDAFLGALCLVGNCGAMAGYFVLARRLTNEVPATTLTGWAYLGAAAWMALTAAAFVPAEDVILPQSAHVALVYWVFVVSIVSYSILTSATSVLVATHVAAFICVQPLAGAALGWLVFGERVTLWDGGAVMIVMGLFLVTWEGASGGPSRPGRVAPSWARGREAARDSHSPQRHA